MIKVLYDWMVCCNGGWELTGLGSRGRRMDRWVEVYMCGMGKK